MNRVERMRMALATATKNDMALASGLAKAEWGQGSPANDVSDKDLAKDNIEQIQQTKK